MRAGVLIPLCLAASLCAAKVPTIDQSLSFQALSAPQISPDGRYVAYVVHETNWEENAFESEIWIWSAAAGERYQLTNGKKSSWHPAWSPDGKQVAFLSDRDGKTQIYLMSPAGGEAAALTAEESGAGPFRWSPDGRSIVFRSTGPESKARKERKERYGEVQIEDADHAMAHLWVVRLPDEARGKAKEKPKAEPLTSGEQYSVADFEWSPDGSRIAFTAGRDPDFSSTGSIDLYSVRLDDKFVKQLVSTPGPESSPVWSPDGKELAFVTSNGQEYFYYSNRRIAVVPAEGGAPRVLTDDFDENPSLEGWGPDGIYFTALQRVHSYLFRLNPVTSRIERAAGDEGLWLSSISFRKDYRELAFLGLGPNRFAEVYVSPTKAFAARQVTNSSEQYREFQLAAREVIRWKSSDGTPIEGVLIKPAGYEPGRRYPLLVLIHGGPTGIDRPSMAPDRTYPIEMLASKGAVILRPNYRGSAGYGEKFRSLNVRNLGVGDAWDVISGVDFLIEQGIADRERVGAMGWSQGGYISAFLTCSSDRFKAISVGAGISNWVTYYVNTDIHPFTRQYLRATPWDDPEIYRKTSPIAYVKSAKTPTLIQHGDQDRRVPIPNAYELYQALQDQGVPVKLAVYRGFGHGINKPKEQRHLMEQNYEWFSRHLWGEEPPAGR